MRSIEMVWCREKLNGQTVQVKPSRKKRVEHRFSPSAYPSQWARVPVCTGESFSSACLASAGHLVHRLFTAVCRETFSFFQDLPLVGPGTPQSDADCLVRQSRGMVGSACWAPVEGGLLSGLYALCSR